MSGATSRRALRLLACAGALAAASCRDAPESKPAAGAPHSDADPASEIADASEGAFADVYSEPPELSDEEQAAAYRAVQVVDVALSPGTASGGEDEVVLTVRNGSPLILLGLDMQHELPSEGLNYALSETATCWSADKRPSRTVRTVGSAVSARRGLPTLPPRSSRRSASTSRWNGTVASSPSRSAPRRDTCGTEGLFAGSPPPE